jgi:DNA-binding PadR family transcriptional regulator
MKLMLQELKKRGWVSTRTGPATGHAKKTRTFCYQLTAKGLQPKKGTGSPDVQ